MKLTIACSGSHLCHATGWYCSNSMEQTVCSCSETLIIIYRTPMSWPMHWYSCHLSCLDILRSTLICFEFLNFLSGIWVAITLMPTLLLNRSRINPPIGLRDYIGWGLWASGFLLEAIADEQKRRYVSLLTSCLITCKVHHRIFLHIQYTEFISSF